MLIPIVTYGNLIVDVFKIEQHLAFVFSQWQTDTTIEVFTFD